MAAKTETTDYGSAAIELDAAAEEFLPFIERIGGLLQLMTANDGVRPKAMPPEFYIRIDDLYSAHEAGARVFYRYLDIYPTLRGEWIDATRQQFAMTLVEGHLAVFSEKLRLLKKCAAIARAKAGLPTVKDHTKVTHHYFGEVHVGDRYSAAQAGAMGPGAHAHDMTFTQTQQAEADKLDLMALASELSELRKQIRSAATEPEHDVALGQVAAAEAAARSGDRNKMMNHLRAAGSWTFDFATKVGVSLASEALKIATGMK